MSLEPDLELRFAKAFALFDAKRQLLQQGWELERVNRLTWAFEVRQVEPGGDRGIMVSAHWEDLGRSSGGGSESQTGREVNASDGDRVTQNPASVPADPDEHQISVALYTGGTMTLSVSVDPLRLRGDDRTFFYDIVDRLGEYREKAAH